MLPTLPLLAGKYVLPIWITGEEGIHRYHETIAADSLQVHSDALEIGVFQPEHSWSQRDELPIPEVSSQTG